MQYNIKSLSGTYDDLKLINHKISDISVPLKEKIGILCDLAMTCSISDQTAVISMIFAKICLEIFNELSAEMCSIDILGIEEGSLSFIAMPPYNPGDDPAYEYRETISHDLLEKAMNLKECIFIPVKGSDDQGHRESSGIFGNNNVLLVPVRVTDKINMVMTVMREVSAGCFSDADAVFIGGLFDDFKQAINNISEDLDLFLWHCCMPHFERIRCFTQEDRLFSMSEELYSLKFRFEALEKKVSVIQSVDQVLEPTFSLEHMSAMINKVIMQSMSVERVSFLYIDDVNGDLLVKGAVGLGDSGSSGFRLDSRGIVTEHVLSIKRVFLCRDMEKELNIQVNKQRGYKTASFIAAPVLVGDQVAAVINVSDKSDLSSFNIDDMERLEVLADKLSIHMKYYQLHFGEAPKAT